VAFVVPARLVPGTVRAIAALGERHDVSVLHLRDPRVASEAPAPAGATAAQRAATVTLGSTRSALSARVAPARYYKPAPDALAAIRAATADAHWVWVEGLPLPWLRPLAAAWRERSTFISWSDDAMSLFALRAARVWLTRRPVRAAARLASAATTLLAERRFLGMADAVVARSGPDAAWLGRVQSAPVYLLANSVDVDAFAVSRAAPVAETQPVVAFVGSDYEPNLHGIRWFLDAVWPGVVRAMPGARCMVAGWGLHADAVGPDRVGVEVLGDIDSVPQLLARARVVVSPIFYGGGLPQKALDGAAAARPTVITPYCARALSGGDGFEVARSAAEWIGAVTTLLDDPKRAAASGAAAFDRVADHFGMRSWRGALATVEVAATSR
jgi:glycosyltransferase involved in cell wall biosynthesis